MFLNVLNCFEISCFCGVNEVSCLSIRNTTCDFFFSDLALGDCHLIPIDDVTSRKDGNDWVSIYCDINKMFQGLLV